jgi:hypothetical protein
VIAVIDEDQQRSDDDSDEGSTAQRASGVRHQRSVGTAGFAPAPRRDWPGA